jgi:hypothetical protein
MPLEDPLGGRVTLFARPLLIVFENPVDSPAPRGQLRLPRRLMPVVARRAEYSSMSSAQAQTLSAAARPHPPQHPAALSRVALPSLYLRYPTENKLSGPGGLELPSAPQGEPACPLNFCLVVSFTFLHHKPAFTRRFVVHFCSGAYIVCIQTVARQC